jgi:glycosyltransferase involved in cell wall biosynthesis
LTIKEGISLFLPAYNEAENVEYMVNGARKVLSSVIGDDWEIIVVDDGSTDSTPSIVAGLSSRDPRVRLVSHECNRGFGSAILSGIGASRFPWIFYTDCDGQFDLDEFSLLWRERNRADIVSGFRRRRNDPGMRLLYSLLWNTLTTMLFLRSFKDVDASFKLYRASIFESIKPKSTCGVIDFEILTLARDSGFRVVQVPVSHYPRRAGTVSFEAVRSGFIAWVRLEPIMEMFRQLMAFRLRTWKGRLS